MISRRTIYICLAAVSLLRGTAIYVLVRPSSLLMFSWADSVGLAAVVHALRAHSQNLRRHLPPWFLYSFPFALWVISYLLSVRAIWCDSTCRARYVWLLCVPFISVAAELCQRLRVLPGTFDFVDLLTIGLATAFVFKLSTADQASNRRI